MRIVGLFSLATGAFVAAAMASLGVGEPPLFFQLWWALRPGDIVLGDRYFGSYHTLARLFRSGMDGVFRLHQCRKSDFRKGHRLGPDDHLVEWRRGQKPKWMGQEVYDLLPESLRVRELRYRVQRKGFRTREVTVVTTLLDSEKYSAEAIAELYGFRWEIELNFRHIKTTMKMDILRSETPEMVRKEVWAHLLAYNLIRTVMWEAAHEHGVDCKRLSLKGTLDHLNNFAPLLIKSDYGKRQTLYEVLLSLVADGTVKERPYRVEPRVVKRRPKQYGLLNRPRAEMRRRAG